MRQLNWRSLGTIAALTIVALAAQAQSPPNYTVTNLPFYATGANSAQQVVGEQCSDGSIPDNVGDCPSGGTDLAVLQIEDKIYHLDQYADLTPCGTHLSTFDGSTTIEPEPLSVSEQGVIALASREDTSTIRCLLTPVLGSATLTNTALGYLALPFRGGGPNNTAFGYQSLFSNTTGKGNAAQGVNALYSNTTGIRNLGIGSNALYDNTTGSYNIGLGFDAGYNVTTGSNNIEIGAPGSPSDNDTIQIGVQGTQTRTTIAGIYGTPITGAAVYVTSAGQLGVLASSERFKTDVATMPELSVKLQQLRPVTFRYKIDPQGVRQYGLIAEEVDKVYPELVIRDEKGKIQGVHYEELAPMLLREVQKQQATVHTLIQQNAAQNQHAAAQDEEIRGLKQQLAKLSDLISRRN